MDIKIRCSDAVGLVIMRMFSAIEAIAQDYKPEDFTFEVGDTPQPRKGSMARMQYWAKLPRHADGTFDMAKVEPMVKKNLEELGAHTLSGIVYDDIVKITLAGSKVTEPALRAARVLKGGTSQRIVGTLIRSGLLEKEEIPVAAPEEGQ